MIEDGSEIGGKEEASHFPPHLLAQKIVPNQIPIPYLVQRVSVKEVYLILLVQRLIKQAEKKLA